MKIEFLLNEIKDIEKLYQIDLEDNPFGENKNPCYIYIGKDYLENNLQGVMGALSAVKEFAYQQSFGRIANEVFVVVANGVYYEMIFTIDTYRYEKARMKVSIERNQRIEAGSSGNYIFPAGEVYDSFLEQLKISVKDTFKKDWAV